MLPDDTPEIDSKTRTVYLGWPDDDSTSLRHPAPSLEMDFCFSYTFNSVPVVKPSDGLTSP
jgi:hypothetical protein